MVMVWLWLNEYRVAVFMVAAGVMWVGAYIWYFRPLINVAIKQRSARSWAVDLSSQKIVKGGRNVQQ
jgi:hypothetical protein